MEAFLRARGVALTRQGHAVRETRLLDPADADAASLVTIALREATTLTAEPLETASGEIAIRER